MKNPFITTKNPAIKFPESLSGRWEWVAKTNYEKHRPAGCKSPDGVNLGYINARIFSSYTLNPFDGSVRYQPPRCNSDGLEKPVSNKWWVFDQVHLFPDFDINKNIVEIPRFLGREITPNLLFRKNQFYYTAIQNASSTVSLKFQGNIDFHTNKVKLVKEMSSKDLNSRHSHIFERKKQIFEGLFDPDKISFEVTEIESDYPTHSAISLQHKEHFPQKMYFWLADQDVYDHVKRQLGRKKSIIAPDGGFEEDKEDVTIEQEDFFLKKGEDSIRFLEEFGEIKKNLKQLADVLDQKYKDLKNKYNQILEDFSNGLDEIIINPIWRDFLSQELSDGMLGKKGDLVDAAKRLIQWWDSYK